MPRSPVFEICLDGLKLPRAAFGPERSDAARVARLGVAGSDVKVATRRACVRQHRDGALSALGRDEGGCIRPRDGRVLIV